MATELDRLQTALDEMDVGLKGPAAIVWSWARRVANLDYEAAYSEYLFSTGRYENPEDIKRIIDAALGITTDEDDE